MARCEECLHFEVCEALEQGNGLMKVSPIHCGYYKNAADVVSKSEVAREIMQEVRQALLNMVLANSMGKAYDIEKRFAEIEKKYTEG